ncbi:MAG: prepilin-type N-terminal cleavage/methylation domain-containing protein [bacterium]|nr:prepilin-type N-terminal cleavage/methylation domain-containing protein [bacterium]
MKTRSINGINGNAKGFTLIEMIITVAIIAILAGMITPLAVNYITTKQYDACREELEIIKKAIVGDASLVDGGIRSSFGFVGDLGIFPANLQDLVTNAGAYPAWPQADALVNWNWGWRGPYLSEIRDPWGNTYNYILPTTNPLIWAVIWSTGPAGADNIFINIRTDEAFSRVMGNVQDPCGSAAPCAAPAGASTVTIYYPDGQAALPAPLTITLNAGIPIYDSDNLVANPTGILIPIGIRTINAAIPYYVGTVVTPGVVDKLIYINNGPLASVNLTVVGPCN